MYLHHMDQSTRLGDAMRIGIEGKVLGWHGSGIGRYATSLTRALLREAVGRDKDCTFVIFTGPQTSQDALTGYQGAHYQHAVPFKSSLLRSLISCLWRFVVSILTCFTGWITSGYLSLGGIADMLPPFMM